jgi:hypothetical protein
VITKAVADTVFYRHTAIFQLASMDIIREDRYTFIDKRTSTRIGTGNVDVAVRNTDRQGKNTQTQYPVLNIFFSFSSLQIIRH